MAVPLPPQVHVFVRDWLSSNNVVLKSDAGHVVIDSGYHTHAPLTLGLLEGRFGLAGGPLALLVNSHCHSDHIGGNAAVRERYGCPIAVPVGEAELLDPWDAAGLLLTYADQHAPQFRFDRTIAPGDVNRWGDLDWEALAAPGHDMGALMFYNRAHRVLITGDALWANGFGFVLPREIDATCLPATQATLDLIASLDVGVVVPGHGEPFVDVAGALARAYSRLAALEADPVRNARHIMKAMLSASTGPLPRNGLDRAMATSSCVSAGYCLSVTGAPNAFSRAARLIAFFGLTSVSPVEVTSSIGGASARAKLIGWVAAGSAPSIASTARCAVKG